MCNGPVTFSRFSTAENTSGNGSTDRHTAVATVYFVRRIYRYSKIKMNVIWLRCTQICTLVNSSKNSFVIWTNSTLRTSSWSLFSICQNVKNVADWRDRPGMNLCSYIYYLYIFNAPSDYHCPCAHVFVRLIRVMA